MAKVQKAGMARSRTELLEVRTKKNNEKSRRRYDAVDCVWDAGVDFFESTLLCENSCLVEAVGTTVRTDNW